MNRLLGILAAVSLVCVAGCGEGGPKLGTVTGTVTMDGQPLADALVTFMPVEPGPAATGTTDAAGKYQLLSGDRQGAVLGQHKVAVKSLKSGGEAWGKMSEEEYQKAAMGGRNASAYDNATVVEPIPARYNANTELVKEVESGENVIDLELTSS